MGKVCKSKGGLDAVKESMFDSNVQE